MDTKLVIFDLDGTLLNTLGDLAEATNEALKLRGLPTHTYNEFNHFVGNGITRLIERALPRELRSEEMIRAVRTDFVAYYTAHIDVKTEPYPGIVKLLDELTDRGIKLAVASNKFQAGTEKLVKLFFPKIRFVAVNGQREGVPLKPNPEVVNEICVQAGIAKEQTLYVGDSDVDMQTAAAADVRSVGAAWGFRGRSELEKAGAQFVAERPEEIIGRL